VQDAYHVDSVVHWQIEDEIVAESATDAEAAQFRQTSIVRRVGATQVRVLCQLTQSGLGILDKAICHNEAAFCQVREVPN
jgi:hypothetical protein